MTIEEAVEAALAGSRVLMCYDTEDECVNEIMRALNLTQDVDNQYASNRLTFDNGGSIRFLPIKLNSSEHWGSLYFHEGNALAREIFPGCFQCEH
jgi:hypothetical protein